MDYDEFVRLPKELKALVDELVDKLPPNRVVPSSKPGWVECIRDYPVTLNSQKLFRLACLAREIQGMPKYHEETVGGLLQRIEERDIRNHQQQRALDKYRGR